MQQSTTTWLLSDGHAGNVRQAAALARALGLSADREWTLQPSAMARRLSPRRWPGAAGSAFGADFAAALNQAPALAIGCGRQAALATRLLRGRGAKAVQILDPRIATRHWDAVIAPAHDRLRGANVLCVQGSLNPVDDAWLAQARVQFPSLLELPSPRVALLLGGPSAHLRDADAISGWFQHLGERVRTLGGSLLATASRRTPDSWIAALYRARAGVPGLFWRGAEDGPNPYAGLLACAEHIVLSPDSVNMLSEAAATRLPVQVLAPQALRGRPARFLDELIQRERVRGFDGDFDDVPATIEPLRETARVAAELRHRLSLPD